MKNTKDREMLELCQEALEAVGAKRLSDSLASYLNNPTEDNVSEIYDEAVILINNISDKKSRYFRFGTGFSLMKYFIMLYEKEWTNDGRPEIIINRLSDESGSFKDNPIKNLHVIYEDESQRDQDFEKLTILLR